MPRKPQTVIEALGYDRPSHGFRFSAVDNRGLPATHGVAWRSHGGPTRQHPARGFPHVLEVGLPDVQIVRLHLLGVFAMHANPEFELRGTVGASIQLLKEGQIVSRQDLVNGRHYEDARVVEQITRIMGDGTSLETVGQIEVEGEPLRIDILTIDIPPATDADAVRLKDLGSSASFVIFDIFAEYEAPTGCPFRSTGGGISLSEIGPIIRLGDRVRFSKALRQLETSLLEGTDLDECRGQALTFLAVVTAGMLEMGGRRELHREQLAAARELEGLNTVEEIAGAIYKRIVDVAEPLFKDAVGPSSYLVDRALAIVERNFAKTLTDAAIARQLGLSTSHFRYLFRQATGQPFHKYLIALRLEKARQMLIDEEVSVGAVAKAVGFAGLSHFSRAFSQRFNISPTSIRRSVD